MQTAESEVLEAQNNDELVEESDTYVIFSANQTYYGLNSAHVTEMIQVTEITATVDSPHYVRGVANLRGIVIPIVNLRSRLGMKSLEEEAQEFLSLLNECENGHVHWLKELEAVIDEKREFHLARDPHKCKFGLWYDNYKSKDMFIAKYLLKFDKPHQEIHKIADQALDLAAEDKIKEAKELIEKTRATTLSELLALFTGLKKIVEERVKSVVMVLQAGQKIFGLEVDDVNSVLTIDDKKREAVHRFLELNENEKFIKEMAKLEVNGSERVVMILNPGILY